MGPLRHSLAALTAALAIPAAGTALLLRPAWRRGLGQRLGGGPSPAPGGAWIHGASAGEALLVARLAARLRGQGVPVFGSTTTLAGRSVLRQRMPELCSGLAPVDHPWCVAAAIRRVQPAALVLIETELWPSLIAGAQRRGAPVVLLSARLSDRSHTRYGRLRRLVAPTLRRITRIGARSERDAERFVSLGADPQRVRVTGDLKLEPPAEPPRLADELGSALAGVPLLVAGSTHPGEEAAALEALRACEEAGLACGLVLAPRRIERSDAVVAEAEKRGRVVWRRSALPGERLRAGEVLVLDTLGELGAVYAAARLAFVGGTLAPVGGHNLLEPVQVGTPVCFGPQIANVRETAQLLGELGVGRAVADADELARRAVEWMTDPELCARAQAGRDALCAHRGSMERSLALLAEAAPGLVR